MFLMDIWNFLLSKKKLTSIFWQNGTYFICITELPICEGSRVNLNHVRYYTILKYKSSSDVILLTVKNICMFDETSERFEE